MINIANRIFKADEAGRGFSQAMMPYTATVEDVEGVQYIMMNPSWKGTSVWLYPQTVCELPYLKVKANISVLNLEHIATGYLNFAEAKYIRDLLLNDNPTIEHIDISASTALGQGGVAVDIQTIDPSRVAINNCPELKTIVLPQKAIHVGMIQYANLPLLEEVNLSQFSGIG